MVKLGYGAIDARSETEVVCVEDEAGWHAGLEECRAEGEFGAESRCPKEL
jgi:hypothetical protein